MTEQVKLPTPNYHPELTGKRITHIQYMTKSECQSMGWKEGQYAIQLETKEWLFAFNMEDYRQILKRVIVSAQSYEYESKSGPRLSSVTFPSIHVTLDNKKSLNAEKPKQSPKRKYFQSLGNDTFFAVVMGIFLLIVPVGIMDLIMYEVFGRKRPE